MSPTIPHRFRRHVQMSDFGSGRPRLQSSLAKTPREYISVSSDEETTEPPPKKHRVGTPVVVCLSDSDVDSDVESIIILDDSDVDSDASIICLGTDDGSDSDVEVRQVIWNIDLTADDKPDIVDLEDSDNEIREISIIVTPAPIESLENLEVPPGTPESESSNKENSEMVVEQVSETRKTPKSGPSQGVYRNLRARPSISISSATKPKVQCSKRRKSKRLSPQAPPPSDSRDEGDDHPIGDEYQAIIPLLLDTDPNDDYGDDNEYEEDIWTPKRFEIEDSEKRKEMEDSFNEQIRSVYWLAIWRQFKGRILFEDALQNLKKHGYDFAASLQTIDQVLKKRPNVMKHPCMGQATRMAKHGLNEMVTMRELQKTLLPNFLLSEVHHYRYQFVRFFMFQHYWDRPCLCEHALCKAMDFEPRFGCSNCAKDWRHFEKGDPMCLICQTYKNLTGEMRPVKDTYFTKEEKQLIVKWNEMQMEAGKVLKREEFEKLIEEEKVKRWMNLEITEEEKLMMNFQDPKNVERYSKIAAKGEYLVSKLKPFVLPLFPACKCDESEESKRMIEKENLIVPKIQNPVYVFKFEKKFNPWVDEEMYKKKRKTTYRKNRRK
ncbi:hypothetical protein GCK72_012384 [Caenorhabditis remanei]|uniref:ELM2 domain-containing protein n=1 Tax=Caenorhabditis remanei TaxID=31234 RepID=A0A6A5GMU5_CAERE|nr:hypothetical protein GCK72_012384 [Caenorhabditis remanei]KAF1755931.1 hypothetical protein GCK72_012384 [Caenorhabditis remanei]